MATATLNDFLRRLTRELAAETLGDQSDRQLVERALAGREEALFQAIVQRHGAMVYRVCLRVLQQPQDAEDAFQATFLVLAQKLGTVRKHASLASWLHGVAHRVALKAKAQSAARRRHEVQASLPDTLPPDDAIWGEVRSALDVELGRLPDKWRLPLILCYLEGRTQDEAANQLAWSKSTLKRRLEEARDALGRRLKERGILWSAALSAVLLSDSLASAAPGLVEATVDSAAAVAAGTPMATAASAEVAALTEGVLKTMFLTKLKIAALVFLTLALLGTGIGMLAIPAMAEQDGAKNGVAERPVQETKAPKLDLSKLQVDTEPKTHLQKLQGTWMLVEAHMHGKKVAAKYLPTKAISYRPHQFAIAGEKIVMHVNNGDTARGRFVLDTAKKPKEITISWLIQWPAIYNLEGDTLTICFNEDANLPRPDEFRTLNDSDRVLLVYKRAQPNEDPKKEPPKKAEDDATKADLQKLQGTWTLVEAHMHGKKVAAEDLPTKDITHSPHKLAVADEKKIVTHRSKSVMNGAFELDATKTPREITIQGYRDWWPKWRCIYKVEGDTLTICFNEEQNWPRPDEFRTLADSDRVLFVYERAKKEK
jgi:RNA polymerase sigma factor (sigma-70 family)